MSGTEIPAEVQATLDAAIADIKERDMDGLIALAAEHGAEYKADDVNQNWLRRKCAKLVRAKILQDAGIEEKKVAEPEKTEAAPSNGEEKKKPGRKRMDKTGDFKIVLAEGQSCGRDGSTKFKIVTSLKDKEKFSYDEFKAAVVEAMSYDAAKEEFGVTTKFPSIGAAQGAWFSELKNKQDIIQQVGAPTPAE